MAAPAPKICVGLAGPGGVGKSALLKALLDNEFDLESAAQRCRTEDLEFEHTNIFKCSSAATRATCYRSSGHLADMEHIGCDTPGHEEKRFSLSGRAAFVDCPGDLFYVSTILKGIMMADGVLILSQPTNGFEVSPIVEALAGAHLMGKSIIVVQIIKSTADKNALKGHLKEIRRCMKNLKISPDDVPIVEVHTSSALKGIGAVCREVMGMMPRPRGELAASSSSSGAPAAAFMLIARSSVVDPVGEEEVAAVEAAAAAGNAITFATIIGRVMQGIVSAGDEVEVRPGIMMIGDDGNNYVCYPIKLKVVSVLAVRHNSEDGEEEAEGDGLVALRASATIVNVDENAKRRHHHRLVGTVLGGDDGGTGGHVLGHPGSLPDVYDALMMDVLLIPRMCDPYTEEVYDPLPPVEADEKLLLIIGTMSTCGSVTTVREVKAGPGRKKEKRTTIVVTGLSPPTCARHRESILICRPFKLSWHVIGSGTVLGGRKLDQKALRPHYYLDY